MSRCSRSTSRTDVADLVHERPRHRLDDEVEVDRPAAVMRPEADIHLVGLGQLRNDRRSALQERTQFLRLIAIELRYMNDVPFRLHDQSPDAERPDGVLDNPARALVDHSTREIGAALREVAREASLHGRYGPGLAAVSICARWSRPE